MAVWYEPKYEKVSVTPYPGQEDVSKPHKPYGRHETTVVVCGFEDGFFFYPKYREIRHTVDGELIETVNLPLKDTDLPIEIGKVTVHRD